VADLAAKQQNFRDKNAELAVIGCGDPKYIKEFKNVTGYSGNVFTDPSRQSYRILSLTSSIGGLLGMQTLRSGLSAIKKGVKPGSLQGSALQLGGAVIVGSDATIRYYYKGKEAGDSPPEHEMLNALP